MNNFRRRLFLSNISNLVYRRETLSTGARIGSAFTKLDQTHSGSQFNVLRKFTSTAFIAKMPLKAPPTDLPIHAFSNAQQLEDFLDREHTNIAGFYVKLAKKASGIASVSADEAIEVALCFGWIDGGGGGLDDTWWLKRFTPRRSKSLWSQKNVNTVSNLMEQGRVRPQGIAAIEAAKADGRWERAYAGPATITVPDDFSSALKQESQALAFFETLNRTDRYSVLWRIQTSSPRTRAKRIDQLVQLLANKETPRTLGKPTAKAVKKADTREPRVKKRSARRS